MTLKLHAEIDDKVTVMEDWEQNGGEHITLHMLCMHESGYEATY